MRVFVLLLLGLASIAGASAQVQPDVTLTVKRDEAQLIVQMLDALACANVAQLSNCIKALELKRKLQQEIIGQESK